MAVGFFSIPPLRPIFSKDGFLERVWERFFQDIFAKLDSLSGDPYAQFQDVTVSGGTITLSGEYPLRLITVDTEGGAAADDLTSISGGTDGERVILQSTDSARVVAVKDGSGLLLQADFSLNNTADKIELLRIEDGIWHELSRASNG